ncbi:MAG: hypothetical protein ACC628_15980 [Pirellulaceae bacterium]
MRNWVGRSVGDLHAIVAACAILAVTISLPARAQQAAPANDERPLPEEGVQGINGLIQYVIVKKRNRDELRFSLNGILPGMDHLWKDLG